MSETIIAGVDLDAPVQARDAVALAGWLADVTGSELLLATVFAPRMAPLARQIDHGRRELSGLAPQAAEVLAIAGNSPARVLHTVCLQRRPRALVIGSSRSGPLGTVSLGSVGEALLHGAAPAVAVTPSGFRDADRAGPAIGVAYGTTPESDAAVHVAVDIAKRAGARLTVLTVDEGVPRNSLAERHPGERLDRALAGASVDHIDLVGDPAIALAAASAGLDLLVAGSRSYGPLGAVLLGAVTRRLVRMTECPVMVVPRARDAAHPVALVGGMETAVEN